TRVRYGFLSVQLNYTIRLRIKEAIAVKNRNEKERCEDRRANTDPHRLYLLLFIMPKRRA
ncbi:hypothetical protein, partial [uncultured Dialister sp.]|uniref:hypothetical protein n=1 Tax=uncultured Dialister sp. TaxID=278064 RepID=UPI002670A362